MTADARDLALKISESLFRLTTECIRLLSNEARAHESLSSLTLHVVGTDCDMAAHDTDILRQHLNLVPACGDIAVLLALPQTDIDRLGAVRTSLEKRVGCRLTSEEALSLLLFDYVVEQKAARVLETLGLCRSDSPDPGSETVPFSD